MHNFMRLILCLFTLATLDLPAMQLAKSARLERGQTLINALKAVRAHPPVKSDGARITKAPKAASSEFDAACKFFVPPEYYEGDIFEVTEQFFNKGELGNALAEYEKYWLVNDKSDGYAGLCATLHSAPLA